MNAVEAPLVSIIVNNFNYGRFIGEAIDSALAQTHPRCEVIAVDDGSTDDSRAVIERYGARVVPLFQANGGQGAAMNAGFARSRGQLVLFLDSDDVLEPQAVARAVELFAPGVDRVQFALRLVDETGARIGAQQYPARGAKLEVGLLADRIARAPIANTPPTSGNVFSRRVLEKILPMPEAEWRICADSYLLVVSALHGPVAATDEPLGRYRVHRKNNWNATGVPSPDQLLKTFDNEARKVAALRRAAQEFGITVDEDWELANPAYLDMRLFMLVHHPDRHPFAVDTVGRLARVGVRTALSSGARPKAILKAALYASLPLLPRGARRALTEWRVAPQTLPAFLRRGRSRQP
jgi:glycosyltransferase involved in cell wall biosynthesis